MSDNLRGGKSGFAHMSQISEETVFCNTNSMQSKMAFSPNVLINKVPKLCGNVNVSNGRNQRHTTTVYAQSLLQSAAIKEANIKAEMSIEANPVGSLQELCMARHFPFPVYTFADENLMNKDARFTVMCSISLYNSTGTGITKQAAKKEAAYLMYKQIGNLSSEELHTITDKDCENKGPSYNHLMFVLCHESQHFLRSYFDSIERAPRMQNTKRNKNLTAAETLKIISGKEKFTYSHVVIFRSIDQVKVLMQVNTIPVIVISESGKTEEDAHESASRVILTYMQLQLNLQ